MSRVRVASRLTAVVASGALVGATLLAAPVVAQAATVYNTPGNYTWVAPSGVTKIRVKLIGGGGAGGTGRSSIVGGAGGFSGVLTAYLEVVPGDSYQLTVGAAGAADATAGGGGAGGHRTEFSGGSVWAIAGGGGGGGGAGTAVDGYGGYGGSTNIDDSGVGGGSAGGNPGHAGTAPNVGGLAGQPTGSGGGQAGTVGGVLIGGPGGVAPANAGSGGGGGDGAGGGGGGASGGVATDGSGGAGAGAGASGSSTTNSWVGPPTTPGPGNGGVAGAAGTDGYAEITALNPAVVQTVAGNQEVTVSWSEPTQPTDVGTISYTLYQDGVPVTDVTGTSKTITGLTNGQQYTFTVIANATDLSTSASATATPEKDPQQQPNGAIPKKLKNKGKTVVNKREAITVQGQPVHARIRQVSQQRGDLVCWRAIRGPQRKLTINTTGNCTAKLRITYTAPATDRYLAYTKTVTYKIKRIR